MGLGREIVWLCPVLIRSYRKCWDLMEKHHNPTICSDYTDLQLFGGMRPSAVCESRFPGAAAPQ